MDENLKVNSKTSILEFKRKHNKLVESGIIEIVNGKIQSGDINLENAPIEDFEIVESGLSGRTFVSSYSKIVIYHGILFITLNGFLKNETEETISSGSIYFECQLTDDVASKIYDLDGIKLTEPNNSTPYQIVLTSPISTGDNAQTIRSFIITRSANSKKLRFGVYIENMTAGSVFKLSGRTYMLLI